MIEADIKIHYLHNRGTAVEESYLTDACTLECGSFITANDNIDGLFGKYNQAQCKSSTTCTIGMEIGVIKKNNTNYRLNPFSQVTNTYWKAFVCQDSQSAFLLTSANVVNYFCPHH